MNINRKNLGLAAASEEKGLEPSILLEKISLSRSICTKNGDDLLNTEKKDENRKEIDMRYLFTN